MIKLDLEIRKILIWMIENQMPKTHEEFILKAIDFIVSVPAIETKGNIFQFKELFNVIVDITWEVMQTHWKLTSKYQPAQVPLYLHNM